MSVKVPLSVGDKQTFTKTIAESDVYQFAGITGDFSPFHVNEEYMKGTQYGTRIAHGVLTFALSSTASTLIHQPYDDECPVASYGYDHVRFTGPVYFGDTITCNYEVISVDEETGKTVAKVEIVNQNGDTVCVAEHILKFWVIGQKVCLGASTSYWDKGLLSGTLTRRFLAPIPSVHLHP